MHSALGLPLCETLRVAARVLYRVGGLNGLTSFAPQINMAANPLWGRNMECPGEDPHVTSVFAFNYVKAMQGDDHPSGLLRTVTTPKHFMGQIFEGERLGPVAERHNGEVAGQRHALHDARPRGLLSPSVQSGDGGCQEWTH